MLPKRPYPNTHGGPTINTLHGGGRVDPRRPSGVKKKRKNAPRLTMKKYDKATLDKGRFDAFQVKEEYKDETSGRIVKTSKVIEPEDGIHSKQWALSITPQSSALLSIPLDIRQRIFELYLYLHRYWAMYSHVSPQKSGQKFRDVRSYNGSSIIKAYRVLSLISRQIYVEVVGSGLFYRVAKFHFSSTYLMENYLGRINPLHMQQCIRYLSVHVKCTGNGPPRGFFELLEQMEGLRELKMYARQNIEDVVWPLTSAKKSLIRTTMLEKIKGNKSWEVMKGRLESFELNWSVDGHIVKEDDTSVLESVGELKKMLVGRRKAASGQEI